MRAPASPSGRERTAGDARRLGLCAGELVAATGGKLLSGDPTRRFSSIAIDSRAVAPGALFVALPGERVDGHDFIPQAIAAGAAGVLTARGPLPAEAAAARGAAAALRATAGAGAALPFAGAIELAGSLPLAILAVDDTLAALQAMAVEWRRRLAARVIGIAGSNGKTTTKQVVASVLGVHGATFATPGNENSQIGAPLAILAAPLDTRFLVLELGTSAPGELGRLAAMARPELAVVTAAFAEHLEFLGSIDGVIEAETEILDHLPAGALALVGSAEPGLVAAARRRGGLRLETVGRETADAWRIGRVAMSRDGTRFALVSCSGQREWHIPLLGEPAAWAAAFAVAVASELGLEEREIQRGLDGASPAAHRLAPLHHPTRPIFVLDDCYNSNPASARAAIEAALALAAPGERLVLVLGDMLELGAASEAAHRELGEDLARLAPGATLLAVGDAAALTAQAARDCGARCVEHAASAEQASLRLVELLRDGCPTTLLVKGSRGIGLERAVQALLEP